MGQLTLNPAFERRLRFALLVNIVVTAILSTPVPFRYFTSEPANLLPSTLPYVWLPTFLVQAALFGHLLIFRAIGRRMTPSNNAFQPTPASGSV